MASEKFIICRTAPKLKHTALRENLCIVAGTKVAVMNFKVAD